MAAKRGKRERNPTNMSPADRRALNAARKLSQSFHGTSHVCELSQKERKPLPRFAVIAGDLLDFSYKVPRTSTKAKLKPLLHKTGERGGLFQKAAKANPLLVVDPVTKRATIMPNRSPMRFGKNGFVG